MHEPARTGAEGMSDRENILDDLERQKIPSNQERSNGWVNQIEWGSQDFTSKMENSPQPANDYNNKAKQYLGDFHRNLTQDLNNAPNS